MLLIKMPVAHQQSSFKMSDNPGELFSLVGPPTDVILVTNYKVFFYQTNWPEYAGIMSSFKAGQSQ